MSTRPKSVSFWSKGAKVEGRVPWISKSEPGQNMVALRMPCCSALTQIGSTIGEIRNASSSARDAFSQQSSATDEIARLAADAAQSTSRVSNEVTAVTGAAERATQAAGQFDEAAEGLRTAARHLSQELGKFRTDLDSAA